MYEIHQGISNDRAAHSWPDWIENISSISELLITLNASSDVFIYFLKHRAAQHSTSVETGFDNILDDAV